MSYEFDGQEPKPKIPVLVVGATGRMGRHVCEALLEKGNYQVYGTTRTVPKLVEASSSSSSIFTKGVTPIEFSFGDAASAEKALSISQAKLVFFMTDFFQAAKMSGATEETQGKIVIDACRKHLNLDHLVFASVADCDRCPDSLSHFKSKYNIEKYLSNSGLPFSIVRPVAFYENFDDPKNWNPLTKGVLKGLWREDVKVKLVACEDIGKAVEAIFSNPAKFRFQKVDAVGCNATGKEVADALSCASGIQCKYSMVMPAFLRNLVLPADLGAMTNWIENEGYSADLEQFRQVVPNPIQPKEFFLKKGKWSKSGEAFLPEVSMPEQAKAVQTEIAWPVIVLAGLAGMVTGFWLRNPAAMRKLMRRK